MQQSIATALAIVAVVVAALSLKSAVIAWNLWFLYSRPEFADRISTAYAARPVRATLIGLLNTAVIALVALVLLQSKPLGLLGVLLLAGLACAHLWGRTACYRGMAERLGSEPGTVPQPGELLRAAVVVELAFLLPVLGQLLWLGVTLRCAGAFTMALLSGGRPRASVPAEREE
jgi:hypothetical protein